MCCPAILTLQTLPENQSFVARGTLLEVYKKTLSDLVLYRKTLIRVVDLIGDGILR